MNIFERQIEKLSALKGGKDFEEYLSSVLSDLLTKHQELLNTFVSEVLGIESDEDFVISPNMCFPGVGEKSRVFADIAVFNSKVSCVIKNRTEVGANDTWRAGGWKIKELDEYSALLDNEKQKGKQTYLRIFTKYDQPIMEYNHDFRQIGWKDIYSFLRSNADRKGDMHMFLEFLENYKLSDISFSTEDLERMSKNINLFHRLGHLLEDTRVKYGFDLDELKNIHDYRYYQRLVYLKTIFTDLGHADYGFGLKFQDTPSLYVWLWFDKNHPKYEEFKNMLENHQVDFEKGEVQYDEHKKEMSIRCISPIQNDAEMLSHANSWYSEKLDKVLNTISVLEERSSATA